MFDYQKKLRQYAGELPLIEPSVYCYLTDSQGNLLLVRPAHQRYWELPGGALQPQESVVACLQRVILEQLGFLILESRLIKVFSGPAQSYYSSDNVNVFPLQMVFLTSKTRGFITKTGKMNHEICFFATWNIRMDVISPPFQSAILYFINHFSTSGSVDPFDPDRFPNIAEN